MALRRQLIFAVSEHLLRLAVFFRQITEQVIWLFRDLTQNKMRRGLCHVIYGGNRGNSLFRAICLRFQSFL
jgi:hypothetical protein